MQMIKDTEELVIVKTFDNKTIKTEFFNKELQRKAIRNEPLNKYSRSVLGYRNQLLLEGFLDEDKTKKLINEVMTSSYSEDFTSWVIQTIDKKDMEYNDLLKKVQKMQKFYADVITDLKKGSGECGVQ